MPPAREHLTWERDALRAGMDPAEVESRREAEECLHEAAEAAQEAIERQRVFACLMLESAPLSEAESKAKRGEHPLERRLSTFRVEVRQALDLAEGRGG